MFDSLIPSADDLSTFLKELNLDSLSVEVEQPFDANRLGYSIFGSRKSGDWMTIYVRQVRTRLGVTLYATLGAFVMDTIKSKTSKDLTKVDVNWVGWQSAISGFLPTLQVEMNGMDLVPE